MAKRQKRPKPHRVQRASDLTKLSELDLEQMSAEEVERHINRAMEKRKAAVLAKDTKPPELYLAEITQELTGETVEEILRIPRGELLQRLARMFGIKLATAEACYDAAQRALWEKKFPVGSRVHWDKQGDRSWLRTAVVLAIHPLRTIVRWDNTGEIYVTGSPFVWGLTDRPTAATLKLAADWARTAGTVINTLAQQTGLAVEELNGLTTGQCWALRREIAREKKYFERMRREFPRGAKVRCGNRDSIRHDHVGVIVGHDRGMLPLVTIRWQDFTEVSYTYDQIERHALASCRTAHWSDFPLNGRIRKIWGSSARLGESGTLLNTAGGTAGAYIRWQNGEMTLQPYAAKDFIALSATDPDSPPGDPVRHDFDRTLLIQARLERFRDLIQPTR